MILLLGVAHAATWVVGTDAATFTDTLALAASGDTIDVPDGTWAACGDTAGRSLTITGTGTLDGTGCDQALRVASGETVAIEGVTFTNTTGRGLVVEWSTVSLTAVTFQGSGRGDLSGGGIWAYGAAIDSVGCVFQDNAAYEGGAVYLYAYTTWTDGSSIYERNTAVASGGAVMAYYDNTLDIDGARFDDNSAGYYGGAIATWDYTDLEVSNTWLRTNTSPYGGGAIFYYPVDSSAGVFSLDGAYVRGNTAPDGGALWIGWASRATVRDSTFEANGATGTGGAVLAYVTGETTLTGNQFCTNTAPTGGAVSVQWTGADTWSNNVFVENTATYGGAAHRYASYTGALVQNSFVGNTATAWGGAYYASWGYADVRNNLVAHNTGAGLYAAESATLAGSTLAYNGFADNAVADAAGYFYAAQDLDGTVLTDAPGLAGYTPGLGCESDVRVTGTSPFKDAGDPAILDQDGSRSDMGAHGGPGAPSGDGDGDGLTTFEDCDDTDYARHPGATEVCNGADDDCDGVVDDGAEDASTWYTDADGDGFGDPAAPVVACDAPEGAVDNNVDCDDADRWANPEASDYPGDGIDADCDGADNGQVYPDAPPPDGGGCACATGLPGGVAGGRPPAPGSWGFAVTVLLAAMGRRWNRR